MRLRLEYVAACSSNGQATLVQRWLCGDGYMHAV